MHYFKIVFLLVIFFSVSLSCNNDNDKSVPNDKIVKNQEQPDEKTVPEEKKYEKGIRITSPKNTEKVAWRPVIKGNTGDPNSDVWIIVHPMAVSTYWAQPKASMRNNGEWKVQIYLGTSDGQGVGEIFEIMAISNPAEEINEGSTFKGWPKAEYQSEIVEVKRVK